jgi:TolA-binding protein
MDEEARMLELKTIVTKAEEGIKTAEKDISKFDGQLSDGQRVNDEQIVILMSKNPGWSVKEALDNIYKTTPHKLTHLEESKTKAIAARNFFRKQLRQASDELHKLEHKKQEQETDASAIRIFSKVKEFRKSYNQTQAIFEELKEAVLAHPGVDDLVKRAAHLNYHPCYGITVQFLSPNPRLTMAEYAMQLSELTKPGVGSYENVPTDLQISYDGNIQTAYPVDTGFDARTTQWGIREEAPTKPQKTREQKIAEFWSRPPSRVVG